MKKNISFQSDKKMIALRKMGIYYVIQCCDIIAGLNFLSVEKDKNSSCPGNLLQADVFVFPDFIPDVREVICAVGRFLHKL